jgi:protein-S-isoprenylcysteine O-methyltransferase Ste14/Flp pilus assembly pilin Flp
MRRFIVPQIFALLTAALAYAAFDAVVQAIDNGDLSSWLGVGYSVLKLMIAGAFTVFVVTRSPARRRAREPIAYLACAAAILPAVLQTPAETAAPGVVVAGEVVALLGVAWVLVSALALGRCFGVLPEARGLVTHGPYELVRHPLYLGEFTAMAGLLIASPSARNLVAGAVFAGAQLLRMRLEERALVREFPEYAEYASRTPRVVPSPRRLAEPALSWFATRSLGAGQEQPRAGENGQTLLEYALILSLVSIGSVAALTTIGISISGVINSVAGAV